MLKKNLPIVQKFSNQAKIIVIDNNSSDNSKNYIKKKFKNIEIIKHKKIMDFLKVIIEH